MSIEAALTARATSGHSGLAALISDRFWPDVAVQTPTKPYVVYTKVSTTRDARSYGKRSQIVWARFQLDCYATTKPALITLVVQVCDAFDVWAGTSGGITIQDSIVVNQLSNVEGLDTEGQLYRETVDIVVAYTNPAYV